LFSEIKKGIHMAIVTATESRAGARDIYVPAHERSMAHRSYLSPDGKWVLLAEMDNVGWLPCRVVPFDGSSTGTPVGPPGAQCTSAAWSPDGQWMYYTSNAGGSFHIWRQRFPKGAPEQVTFGPTEEEGIAMAPDGRSFISSAGLIQSTVWVRDASGERQVSWEGYSYQPLFSPGGKKVYYLVRKGPSRAFVIGELWMADLVSGRNEPVLPGLSMTGYDISTDDKRVVFAALNAEGKPRLWLASLDRRFSPRQISSGDDDTPIFGPAGEVYFRAAEGSVNFVYRLKEDGSGREKVIPDPILTMHEVSTDGQWVVVFKAVSREELTAGTVAYPTGGGTPVYLCELCVVRWAADGKTLNISFQGMTGAESGRTFAIPVTPGKMLPALPASGIRSRAELGAMPCVEVIEKGVVSPGPGPSTYAFSKQTVQRNLYRVPGP